jgi:O-antigen/teichoic acid export membrane protein
MLVRRVRRLGTNGRLQRGEIFSMAWPVMIADLASYLLGTGVDLLVLAAFRPLPEVALYGAATRLLVLIGTPFRILQGVIPPIISELHAQGKKQELERAVRSAASLAGFPAALVLIAFIVAGPLILSVVFTPFYRNAATILAILSFGRLIAIYTGSAGLTLMMTGHQKAMMVLTLVMGAVSLAAGIAAAPVFGGLGVAIATTVAAITQNVLQLVLARKYVGIYTQAYLTPGPVIAFFSKKQDGATPA